jgi:hypothetical protein
MLHQLLFESPTSSRYAIARQRDAQLLRIAVARFTRAGSRGVSGARATPRNPTPDRERWNMEKGFEALKSAFDLLATASQLGQQPQTIPLLLYDKIWINVTLHPHVMGRGARMLLGMIGHQEQAAVIFGTCA